MAQNTNRAWSDSAYDSGYIPRSFRESSDIVLPTDTLPEFESAFRERDRRSGRSRDIRQEPFVPTTTSRPYAATRNADYSSRDFARVTSDPYSRLSRPRNSLGYRDQASSSFGGSQSSAPRIHAEAFQPMGSHSVAGQKKNVRMASSARDVRWEDAQAPAPRNYRNSADFAGENARTGRQDSDRRPKGNHATSRSKNAEVMNSKAQKREERRRRRRHEQADKKFNRQFSGDGTAASDAGPRAAVTKAEMGSKQRRAMRAQQAGSVGLPFMGGALGTVFASVGTVVMAVVHGFMHWRTLKKTICTVAIIALICACVYTPAQQYYQTLRLNDRLEAEYKAIEERNDALGLDLATLGTREGVEARAHEQFGLVQKGEESANVLGLDYTYDHSTTMMAAIPSGSVEMPDPAWYTPLLDAIFGVEKDDGQ